MDDTWFFFILIVSMLWLIFIPIIGALIGRPKGRGVLGYVLGLLLGPIGLIVAAIVGPTEEQKRIDARKAAHATLGNSAVASVDGDGQSNCKKCAQPLTANICRACGASNPEYSPFMANPESISTAGASAPLKPRAKSNGFAIPAIIFSVIAIFQSLFGWTMVYFFGDWAAGFGGAFSLSSVAIFIGFSACILGIVSLAKKDKSRILAVSLSTAGLLLAASLLLV
jgi:heme A synthase